MHTVVWDGNADDRVHVSCFGGHRPYAFAEHRHQGFWELTCVRHGVLIHTINGVVLRQGPGALALLRCGDRHALAGERVAYVNLSFSTAFARALEGLPRLADDCLALLAQPAPLTGQLPAAQRTPFLDACDRLAAERGSPREGVLLLGLLLETLRVCHLPATPPRPEGPPWLARLLPLLEDDGDPGTLADLRLRAGVSHAHLARSMRRHLALTPSSFLNRCRVQRAARLLASSDLPITAIALRCGFPDPGYFARVFVRHRGLSPGAYRRQEQRFIS